MKAAFDLNGRHLGWICVESLTNKVYASDGPQGYWICGSIYYLPTDHLEWHTRLRRFLVVHIFTLDVNGNALTPMWHSKVAQHTYFQRSIGRGGIRMF